MPSARAASLLRFLSAQREPMLALLERLVRSESPSTYAASQKPVLEILISELVSLDFVVRPVMGRRTGGHLLAAPRRRRRHSPLQLMIGHCDTVWPLGTIESMPVERDRERVLGPGVYDMKGGLVMILFALRALQATGLDPEATPIVFINSDEEIGTPSRNGTSLAWPDE